MTSLPGQRHCQQSGMKKDSRTEKVDEATEPSGDTWLCPVQHQFLQTALSALTLFKTARANVNELLFAYLFFLC